MSDDVGMDIDDDEDVAELAQIVPALGTSLAVSEGPDSSARAVRAYLTSLLTDRSRGNAVEALRRLARVTSKGMNSDPLLVPWASIDTEGAKAIRLQLFRNTELGLMTPGTANLTLSHLRGLIRAMRVEQLISPAQFELVTLGVLKNVPGKRATRGRALKPEEERLLRKVARQFDGYRGPMLETAIGVAVGTGMRREEVCRAPVESVGDGVISVIGKGNKERAVPFGRRVQETFEAWFSERAKILPDHSRIFLSPERPEQFMSPWSLWSLVRKAAHEAFGNYRPCQLGCRCLKIVTGPHDFRRTFATRMLEKGIDIRELQILMGHESIETTTRYDKRDTDKLFEKVREMDIIT